MTSSSRYARQEQIPGWSQEGFQQARVLVAGAGALSNELVKNLTLLGIGHLLIVDFDHIELSNLSRTVLFRDADVGRPKAEAAASAVSLLNPATKVRFIQGDLFSHVGLGVYRHATLVVSGLDNIAARAQVGLCSVLADRPFFDGGIWSFGGEVRAFMPGEGACYECSLSPEDRARASERRSCTGFQADEDANSGGFVPTTVATASIIGGLLAQEVAHYLSGQPLPGGEFIVYNGLKRTMHRTTLERDPTCPYHAPYTSVVESALWSASLTTPLELLERARIDLGEEPVLELGRDFLEAFVCPECSEREQVGKLRNQVPESYQLCPRCGVHRMPIVVSEVGSASAYIERPLATLGVPAGEVLTVRAGHHLGFYELTGDIPEFWS